MSILIRDILLVSHKNSRKFITHRWQIYIQESSSGVLKFTCWGWLLFGCIFTNAHKLTAVTKRPAVGVPRDSLHYRVRIRVSGIARSESPAYDENGSGTRSRCLCNACLGARASGLQTKIVLVHAVGACTVLGRARERAGGRAALLFIPYVCLLYTSPSPRD